MDKIVIKDLEVFAHHGVLPEETEQGQTFFVQVEMELDLLPAGITDDLRLTVNYAEACQLITDTMQATNRQLIEAAAHDVAKALLKAYPQVQTVRVKLDKPSAPIPLPFGCVSVDITRTREHV